MFKLIIKLVIIAAIAHAGIRIVPVFWQYAQFKDKLAETARYGARRSLEQLNKKAELIAVEYQVPIATPVSVTRNGDLTIVDTQYVTQLEYLPRQYYPWKFVIHLEEVPARYDAYLP
jgi:hypothetical protein